MWWSEVIRRKLIPIALTIPVSLVSAAKSIAGSSRKDKTLSMNSESWLSVQLILLLETSSVHHFLGYQSKTIHAYPGYVRLLLYACHKFLYYAWNCGFNCVNMARSYFTEYFSSCRGVSIQKVNMEIFFVFILNFTTEILIICTVSDNINSYQLSF